MKTTIIQQVREARAAVAADFNFDLHQFFAWARKHTAAEKSAKTRLSTNLVQPLETTGLASKPCLVPKNRVRRPKNTA